MKEDFDKENISIIIPVYNTRKYLSNCLDSILCQTYSKLEVILIDDGSTDGSEKICDIYAKQDQRIKVIRQTHLGVVAARNIGIENANSPYIAFVDSDDCVEPDMFGILLKTAKDCEADIVSSGYTKVYIGKNETLEKGQPVFGKFPEGIYVKKQIDFLLENLMCYKDYSSYGISPTLCGKLFKKKLLVQNIERIPQKLTIAEDACLTYMCCMDAEIIYILHKSYYYYIMREDSCIHSADKRCFSNITDCYDCLYQKIVQIQGNRKGLLQQLEKFIAREAIFALKNRFGFSNGGMLPVYAVNLKEWGQETKIVIYGAGIVGSSYYKQITSFGQAIVVLWVDNNPLVVEKNALVQPVNAILYSEYDYILISVKDKNVAENISIDLQAMKVDKEKIVWKEPQFILDVYND